MIDALKGAGYKQGEHRLLPHRSLPFARFYRGPNEKVSLWYQRSLRALLASREEGRYRETLASAGLAKSSLRPDFILVREPGQQVLLVEVKYSAGEETAPDRIGIRDALTYLQDSEVLLSPKPLPRALVVGWNSTGTLSSMADILVASQHSIVEAVELVLERWDSVHPQVASPLRDV
jgi:hypothetical protein